MSNKTDKRESKSAISGPALQRRYTAIGLTQTAFAKAVRRSQPAVSQWIHGKVRVPDSAMEKLVALEAKHAKKQDGKAAVAANGKTKSAKRVKRAKRKTGQPQDDAAVRTEG